MFVPIKLFLAIKWSQLKDWFVLWFCNPYKAKPYGACPVQAEGDLPTGEFYYFRARGSKWSFEICRSEIAWWNRETMFVRSGKYGEKFEAGYMPISDAIKLINKSINEFYYGS